MEIISTLKDINSTANAIASEPKSQEDDDNMLFCKSIAPTLRGLPPRKSKLAKLKIQELLFNIEFE